jgi:multidrug efflux pump subunit AcrA (membrane-fusion protein)
VDTDAALQSSALIQLARRARLAKNAETLGFVIVNESITLLNFRQSALWFPASGVVAVSGIPQVERDAPYTQWLTVVCKFLYSQFKEDGAPVTLNANALPAEFPVGTAADWNDWWPSHAMALPLVDANLRPLGLWLISSEADWSAAEVAIAKELAGIYSHAWRFFVAQPGLRQRMRSWLGQRRRKLGLGIGMALLVLVPVRLTVTAPAEVIPKDAFMVRAPLEGAIDVIHVRPNQVVAQGQPLFDLDTTGLRARLSVARKAYEAAAAEYQQAAQLAVTDDEKGRLDMSQRKGRMEEKAAELSYSEQLLDRVLVRAPRAGVAVFADAADWIGKAVTIGERVMLIADPARVEITIRLPVADAIDLDAKVPVTLYLSNAAQFSYSAQVSYVAHQAEVRQDGVVAYTLRADFSPGETLPRLGTTGSAKLYGNWVPFIYYVLRRPIATVRQWIGW